MKRHKKSDISKIQEKIWNLCKDIVRRRDADMNGFWYCYTCGRKITSPSDAHTSHLIPKSVCGIFLKYDLRNLRVCCMACNVWGGGQGALFYRHMVEEMGQDHVDQLFKDKNRIVQARPMLFYTALLKKYEEMV